MGTLKFFFIALISGFLGAALFWLLANSDSAGAQGPQVLTTSELRLNDGGGRTRMLLTLVRDKPRLFMLDSEGEYRLEMGLGESGEPHVWLRDAEGAAKVQVALTGKGLPSFTLADQQGRVRAAVALSQAGEPTLILRDPQGRDRVALWRDSGGEGLALADEKGAATAALTYRDRQKPSLTFFKDGKAYKVFE
ncbi:MAG: hypothetical protein LBV23_08370 [Deltaproteobacteria bacterium]|nr:hypothetical protein [Deltaproteobacteria bacterium]